MFPAVACVSEPLRLTAVGNSLEAAPNRPYQAKWDQVPKKRPTALGRSCSNRSSTCPNHWLVLALRFALELRFRDDLLEAK